MKIQKIIYSPIAPVVITGVLLIIGFWHGDVVPQRNDADFEPDVYNTTVIQVGGVGSDIYTNRAYYIGDGSGLHQEGFPIYLDKNIVIARKRNYIFLNREVKIKTWIG